MREITFDTETTGLEPKQGHRIVEIGCIELIDKVIFEFIHLFSPHEKSIDFLDSSPA